MAEKRDIKYIAREFSDYKQELVEFAKNYFPDSYNDFSPTSPGMMFIEMAAYVGDILSFYQDTQLQETFLQHAKDPGNLYTMAYMMGYRPKITNVAEVELTVTQNVGALPDASPNWDQALAVEENAVITSNSQGRTEFFVENKIDFTFSSSLDPTDVVISQITNGVPSEFLLTKKAKAFSGTIKEQTETFTEAIKFNTITLDDPNIIGILEIVEEDGITKWYEVPFLGQDSVFVEENNVGADADKVPNSIKLQKVPKRFVTRFNSAGNLIIQFGAGTAGSDDDTFTPDPTNVGLGTLQGISTIDKAYDPSNFLYTQTYGLAPSNVTLTIRYLTGGGIEANVPANTLTSFNATTTIPGGDNTYEDTLAFNNTLAASGGKDGDTVEEIRQNALRSFAEQKRTVTLQDYTVRALSLDPKFGTVAKVFVTQDQLTSTKSATDSIIDNNPLALSLYVLAFDNDKKLITATSTLKNNLRTYMSYYMPLTDALNLKDAFVVNIGINYDILVRPNFNSRDVLLNCNLALQEYFDISKWNINQPINISAIYSLLDRVSGVQTVSKIEVINKQGGDYSEYAYDIKGATRNNIVYPSYDVMIFELKFPNRDIKGRTTTL